MFLRTFLVLVSLGTIILAVGIHNTIVTALTCSKASGYSGFFVPTLLICIGAALNFSALEFLKMYLRTLWK